jgi:uncharacterized protein (TIGR02246 family)
LPVAFERLARLGAVVVLLGGCGSAGSVPGIDEADLAVAETQTVAVDAEAEGFDELRVGETDREAVLAFVETWYAPQIVFDDVSFRQYDEGHEAVAQMYRTFLFYMKDASISHMPPVVGDATVVSVIEFWDITMGSTVFTESEPLVEVDLLEVEDGRLSSNTLFYSEGSISRVFGEEPVFTLVARYLDAWNSGDAAGVADLYADDATRHDGLAQIDAVGRGAIEAEADRWHEGRPQATWEAVVPFAQFGGDRAGVVFNVVDEGCPVTMAVVWDVSVGGEISREIVHYDPASLRQCNWVS